MIMQDSRFMEVSELRHVVYSGWGRFHVLGEYAREAATTLGVREVLVAVPFLSHCAGGS